MNPVINAIDINAECPVYTLEQVKGREPDFDEWKMRNDMVKRVVVQSCDHGFLSLGIDYASGVQGVGYGYRSEGNIGMMICALADLLGTRHTNGDALDALDGVPIRVLHKFDLGASVAKSTYIGHFMEDRFMKMNEWVMTGIVREDSVAELNRECAEQAAEIQQLRGRLVEAMKEKPHGIAEVTKTMIRNAKDVLRYRLDLPTDRIVSVDSDRYNEVVKALTDLVKRLDAEGLA